MQILVIDDKANIIEKVSMILSRLGVEVDSANNGLAGYEKALNNRYDLLIVDHLMPIMNGNKMIQNLKAKQESSIAPVLFMTTQELTEVERLEEYALFDDVISKPLDEKLLLRKINALLPQNTLCQSL